MNYTRCCEIAREITMKDGWKVGREPARPTWDAKGESKRTPNRHADYAVSFGKTALDILKDGDMMDQCRRVIADILTIRALLKNTILTAVCREWNRL